MVKNKLKNTIEFTKTGLVCSGGASKAAAFHIGVCLALRDKGFTFVGGKSEDPTPVNAYPFPRPKFHPQQVSTYVGSSAGSLVTTMLASGLPVESLINSFSADTNFRIPGQFKEIPKIQYRDMLKINWPNASALVKSFRASSLFGKTLESMVLKNMRLPGLFTTAGLAEYLQKHILSTNQFHELKADLFIVGTQLDHSRKIIFGRYGTEKTYDDYSQYASNATISDAVAASMSLPPIFAPYKVQHGPGKSRYYIDGEIRETMSTHVGKENGCDLLICSYTHQPYHYREETGSLVHYGMPAIIIQSLYQAIEQKVYSAKKAHTNKALVVETVTEFFKKKKYPEEDLQELMADLTEKIDFKQKLNYIYIHPEAKDKEMFFGDHFTLKPSVLQEVVTIGYKRAMAELRRYELIPLS